jgi:hypothetical protein
MLYAVVYTRDPGRIVEGIGAPFDSESDVFAMYGELPEEFRVVPMTKELESQYRSLEGA